MKSPRRLVLHALAALGLGVLGWDAFQPKPLSLPDHETASSPPPARDEAALPSPGKPELTHLVADRFLLPGQRLSVEGRVRLAPGAPAVVLSLEGPDGTSATAAVGDAASGESPFSLQHPTPATRPGLYTWKLRLAPNAVPILLGVQVTAPERPKVLILQDHPSFEGSRLQRWLAEIGSPVMTRTRVSEERSRVASSPEAPGGDLDVLDAATLAPFDALVAHPSALDRLSPEEQRALELAIRQDGLGLVTFGAPGGSPPKTPSVLSEPPQVNQKPEDETALPISGAPGSATQEPPTQTTTATAEASDARITALNPWVLIRDPLADSGDNSRWTRLRLADGQPIASEATVLPHRLAGPPAMQPLAWDSRGRVQVGRTPLGRGSLARSLVLDSWRWRQRGATNDYARFWSFLLSNVAKPASTSTGTWSLENALLPSSVDQPVRLHWLGPANTPLPDAEVTALEALDRPTTRLALVRQDSEPARAHAVFWPAHPGWHRVTALPEGPSLHVHIQAPEALASLRAQQQSDARQREAAASTAAAAGPTPAAAAPQLPSPAASFAFLALVFAAGMLWFDSRH